MSFTPLTSSQSISYARSRSAYRNSARESSWGSPVFFVPSNLSASGYGLPGPKYEYGYTYDNSPSSVLGNCTWWCYGRCQEANGIQLTSYGIQSQEAENWYSAFTGSKEAGNFYNNLKEGDIICSNPHNHVMFVEKISGSTVYISESAYSTKSVWADKACIVTTQTLSNLYAGNTITAAGYFSCTLTGVLHTGTGGGGGGGGGGDDPTPSGPTYTQVISNINSPNLTEDITFSKMSGTFNYIWKLVGDGGSHSFSPTISGSTCSYKAGDEFERLIGSTSSSAQFSFSASNSDYVQQSPLTTTITVPPTYKPLITLGSVSKTKTFNNNLIAGYSILNVPYVVASGAPSGYTNSATVSDATFSVNKGILVKTGTTSGNVKVTTGASVSDYAVTLIGNSTDSRGATSSTNTDLGTVKGYYIPEVETDSLYRCDVDGKYKADGEYVKCSFSFMLACESIGNTVDPSDIVVNIGNKSYSDEVSLSEGKYSFFIQLESNEGDSEGNVDVTLTFHDSVMEALGISDVTTGRLEVFRIALSLLDDNFNRVGVAFGKEATLPNTVEFAPNMYIKATDYDGTGYTRRAVDLFKIETCPIPVGGCYIDTTDPSNRWEGTTWSNTGWYRDDMIVYKRLT